jgi:hypothetical protein
MHSRDCGRQPFCVYSSDVAFIVASRINRELPVVIGRFLEQPEATRAIRPQRPGLDVCRLRSNRLKSDRDVAAL